MQCTGEYRYGRNTQKDMRSPEAGFAGDCESPDGEAQNHSWVLCKGNKCSPPSSLLSSMQVVISYWMTL